MDVLCVGAYRAGSTWQYNVAASLVESRHGGQRLGFVLGDDYAPADGPGWRVLKSHDGHRAFGDALDAGALGLYCYRDLRDVAFSLAHLHGLPFETVHGTHRLLDSCLANDAFWRGRPDLLVQRYEDLTADPVPAVRAIAAHLGVALDDGEAERLAEGHSLSANRRRADELARRLRDGDEAARRDPHTLLHAGHVRDGSSGGWRERATSGQLFFLAAVCTDWLVANGYDSPDWLAAEVRRRGWGAAELAEGWLASERLAQGSARRERAARQDAGDARGHAAGLEALVAGLHGVIADLQRQLDDARRPAARAGLARRFSRLLGG